MNKWELNDTGIGGKRYETKIAKKLKGQLISQSGAGSKKGDMTVGNFIIEAKTSTKESISLKKEWLKKIRKAAIEQDKVAALLFSFVNLNGDAQEEWICIPLQTWENLFTV